MTSAHIHVPNPLNKKKVEDISLNDLRHLSNDSFALWAVSSGAKIDGNFIDFDHHRYLLPLYMNEENGLVWRKAAQVGASAMLMLKLLHWAKTHQGRKIGLYLPNLSLAENMSRDRLDPLIHSCPDIAAMADPQDKLSLKKIGDSSIYIFHLGGVSSKDSVPLDFIAFDEVRLMRDQDVDQALERVSHSPYKEQMYLSTCGLPNTSIDRRYMFGKQYSWHSKCRCADGCNLALTFPDCVVEHPKHGHIYVCPKCRTWIKDPQNGRYVSYNPKGDYPSFHVSQMVSPYQTPKGIYEFYKRTTNMQEFYNAKLGLPYVDEDNRGVSMEEVEACIDPLLEWGKPGREGQCAMGIDQGAGYIYATIMDIRDNKKRIRHFEIVEADNPIYMENGKKVSPFNRAAELMREFNVKLCVVDGMPNPNDALQFAQQFPGRVFVQWYSNTQKDVIQWADKAKAKATIRKAGPLLKFKWHVTINRYSGLLFMLEDWRQGNIVMPDPDKLVQVVRSEETGIFQPESVARRNMKQYTRLVRQFDVTNESTGEGKYSWIHTGSDHGAHACLYALVALERLRRQVVVTFA